MTNSDRPILDIALRCLRTNSELVEYARRHAAECGATVDELLLLTARTRLMPCPPASVFPPMLRLVHPVAPRSAPGHRVAG